jgi:polar amino acid transport system substrate-binding protein
MMLLRAGARGAATAVLALCLQNAAVADVLDRIKAAGVLNVGAQEDFAPFDFIEAGQHVGFDVDLFDEIGRELNVKIQTVSQPGDAVLSGLEAGRFDLVASPVTLTKVRQARYRFSTPIAEATVALLKRSDDAKIQTPQDIAGKTVGAVRATAQSQQLRAYTQNLQGGATITEFDGYDDAYAALAAGRVAAVANAWSSLAYVAKRQPDAFKVVSPPFGAPIWFAYVGRKSQLFASLMNAVDAALAKIKGDGRMATLQKKWFGVAFDAPDAAPEPRL